MKFLVYALGKLGCLIVFFLATAEWVWPGSMGLAFDAQRLALILLGAHLLEMLFMFKHVRRYAGPLWVSMVLTMLFGLLHWKPLADTARRTPDA